MSDVPELPISLPAGDTVETRQRRIGRPPILNSDVTKRVADIVRGGNYAEVAAASVGINRDTFYRWLREGARIRRTLDPLDDAEYDTAVDALTDHEFNMAAFSDAIEKAMGESEVIDVLNVRKAASEHWQAAMTRLERRHPQRWGRREAIEVSGQLDGVHVNADTPEAAVEASTVMRSARAADLACDLLEALAGEPASETGGNIPADLSDEGAAS